MTPERLEELRAEIARRRAIQCEAIGPLPLDEVAALVEIAIAAGDVRSALRELVRIKTRKDKEGRYPWYEKERDAAWEKARVAFGGEA